MLTADLVDTRRKGDELVLVPLTAERRARAIDLAAEYLGVLDGAVGKTRDEIDEALDAIEVPGKERRLADAVRKLIDDACEFETGEDVDADAIRREVFLAASSARRDGRFDRSEVLSAIAGARGTTPEAIEASLFADLRGAQRLVSIGVSRPEDVVGRFRLAEAQAVLLRATRLLVRVTCASPAAYRAFFRKLKFLRLLFTIERAGDAYVVAIDGPYSLFDAVTKYGLQLAMLLPTLDACQSWEVAAEVVWGKERRKLLFHLSGAGTGEAKEPRLPDDVEQLRAGIARIDGPWKATRANTVLDLPGAGVCVPDLVLTHAETKEKVYLEVMGYWSRSAVWKRVELVEQGLREKILFAVSERLRVSEEVLPEDASAALYVYKGVMSPRVVLDRATRVAAAAGEKKRKR